MALIQCPECGRQIEKGSKFCPQCGAKLEGWQQATKPEPSDSWISFSPDTQKYKPNIGVIVLITSIALICGGYSIYLFGKLLVDKDILTDTWIEFLQQIFWIGLVYIVVAGVGLLIYLASTRRKAQNPQNSMMPKDHSYEKVLWSNLKVVLAILFFPIAIILICSKEAGRRYSSRKGGKY